MVAEVETPMSALVAVTDWKQLPFELDEEPVDFIALPIGFLGSLPMWSKSPNEKSRMSNLFKWREGSN